MLAEYLPILLGDRLDAIRRLTLGVASVTLGRLLDEKH